MALKLTRSFTGWKQHRCLNCGALFRYRFGGSAAVVALTPERREAKMRKTLDRLVAGAVEQQACPQCGCYQPEMIGRRQRLWTGWLLFALWQGVFWLTALAVNGHLTIPPLTLVSMAYLAACAGVLAWTAWRDPNADLARNRTAAAAAIAAGKLRLDAPGATEATAPPPTRPPLKRVGTLFAVMLVLAIALPALAEGTRRVAGWPLNPAFFPPVAGPGDRTTFYLPETIRCVHGYWRGQARAQLLDPAGSGQAGEELPAVTNDFRWADELSVNPGQPDNEMHPWVTFTLPAQPALAGQTVRVRLLLHTVFPQLTDDAGGADFTFTTAERDLAADTSLVLAGTRAGLTYQCLWYGALVGSGILLTLAARRLWKNSRHEGPGTQTKVLPAGTP